MCGTTSRDKMKNEDILTKISIAPREEKRREKTTYDGLIMCDVDLQMLQSDE